MKKQINMTTHHFDLDRYQDQKEVTDFVKKFNCDGLEVMHSVNGDRDFFSPDMVVGVHLRYFTDWVDFWQGNRESLLKEYGSEEAYSLVYGGKEREVLLETIREDLEYAKSLKASYVVFHVSDIKISEVYTYEFAHTDEEVIDASCEFINELLDGKDYEFEFLMENLWWPGLRMTDPVKTKRLLDGVHYDKKGIMLDTGHLLHTNLELESQDEAVEYVMEMVKAHEDLKEYIRGIHLNLSLSGNYVKDLLRTTREGREQGIEPDFSEIYMHIFQIDSHDPFIASGVGDMVKLINPEYLTFELITSNKEEHEEKLKKQLDALQY